MDKKWSEAKKMYERNTTPTKKIQWTTAIRHRHFSFRCDFRLSTLRNGSVRAVKIAAANAMTVSIIM